MIRRPGHHWVALVAAALISVAFVSNGGLFGRSAKAPDRGLKSGHTAHTEQELDCATCHVWEEGGHVMPGHDLCSICHEIDEEVEDKSSCSFCHTREDQSVSPLIKRMSVETIFGHEPHVDSEISCMECHKTPGEIPDLPKGPLMPWCMECHTETEIPILESGDANVSFAENDCAVCHKEITAETRPRFRGGARIAHDVPDLWMKIHGHEAQFDPAYCAMCHDTVASCDDCHRREKPKNHTVAWRRKPHGLRAIIDQQNCSVCHEEDSCVKCHQKTEPRSHRAGFSGGLNRHCVSCHYPPQESSCTVCHEEIEHRSSGRSPHTFGIFPADCAECHPGGLPHRAPHLTNNTVGCRVCHE
jgi:hypothetical protein